MKIAVRLPKEHLPQEYFDVRYEVLRKPLGSPKGSEYLAKDNDAVNVWAEVNGKCIIISKSTFIKTDVKNFLSCSVNTSHY